MGDESASGGQSVSLDVNWTNVGVTGDVDGDAVTD